MYAQQVAQMDVFASERMVSLYWVAFTGGRIAAAVAAACLPVAWLLGASMPLAVAGAAAAVAAPSATCPTASVTPAAGPRSALPASLPACLPACVRPEMHVAQRSACMVLHGVAELKAW
jgi:hypothetical protein